MVERWKHTRIHRNTGQSNVSVLRHVHLKYIKRFLCQILILITVCLHSYQYAEIIIQYYYRNFTDCPSYSSNMFAIYVHYSHILIFYDIILVICISLSIMEEWSLSCSSSWGRWGEVFFLIQINGLRLGSVCCSNCSPSGQICYLLFGANK